MTAQTLYRFFNAEGALLYVGITKNGYHRWCDHQLMQTWWPEVTRASVQHFKSREAVVAAEKAAIVRERPRYNVTDHPDRAEYERARRERRNPILAGRPDGRKYTDSELEAIAADALDRLVAQWLTEHHWTYVQPPSPTRMESFRARAADRAITTARDLNGPECFVMARRLARMCELWWSENQPDDTPVTRTIVTEIRRQRKLRTARRLEAESAARRVLFPPPAHCIRAQPVASAASTSPLP